MVQHAIDATPVPARRVGVEGRQAAAQPARATDDRGVTTATAERTLTVAGFFGAKPEKFCSWICDLLGYRHGVDELVDLFPGSGVMGRVLNQGRLV